jgi:hypothetical protein
MQVCVLLGADGMGALKNLAQGFAAMVMVIWALSVTSLLRAGDAWLGLLYLLVLAIPLAWFSLLWRKGRDNRGNATTVEKWGARLLSLQGAALACWAFDVATTFYAIDVARIATEENPLGWPLGVAGAMAYYVPTLIFTCGLLYRQPQRTSLYAAAAVTVLTLYMGSMNLAAGINNFGVFLSTASLAAELRLSLLGLVVASDLACAVVFARMFNKQRLRSQGLGQSGSSPLR